MALPTRYAEKPVLLLIENYVLSTIGELEPEKEAGLHLIVQKVWPEQGSDDWRNGVREELGWSEAIEESIKENWQRYIKDACAQEREPDPVEFARIFADAVAAASTS